MRGRRPPPVPALLFASTLALVAIPAPLAFAAVACTYDSTTDVVTVSMPAAGDQAAIVQVSGATDDFTVNSSPCSEPGTGTVATLKTTSLVHVVGSVGSDQGFTIMLLNGYLNGLDFNVDLGGDHLDHLTVLGSAGDDQVHFGSSGFLFRAVPSSSGGGTGIVTGALLLDIVGQAGNDILSLAGSVETTASIGGAYAGTANLAGEGGIDGLYEGTGSNFLSGGTERDFVSYENRTAGVTIKANDFADDGAPAETDNVLSDVEVIIGGSGNDTMRPSSAAPFRIGVLPEHFCAGTDATGAQACGGPGDDTFITEFPFGSAFSGGLGANDTIDASGSTVPLNITLDDHYDDGRIIPDAGVYPASNVRPDVEVILGGTHHDHLEGSDAANRIIGGSGNDTIEGGLGTDTIEGGIGNDTIEGGLGTDNLVGGSGTDLLTYAGHSVGVDVSLDGVVNDGAPGENDSLAGFEHLTGSAFADHLLGDPAAVDLIGGLGGNDTIEGLGGRDELRGGSGEDILEGGDGVDLLEGGTGDDDLFGGAQNDDLDGGADADAIDGGPGPRDKVHYDGRAGDVKVTLGGGANDGEDGEDDSVDDSVEWAFGGSGDDTFVSASRGIGGPTVDNSFDGGDGEDTLKGGDGADILNGGEGDDDILGGSAHDILRGDEGEDTLKGEGGSDHIEAVDDERDKVRGGSGADVADVDDEDDVGSVSTIHVFP